MARFTKWQREVSDAVSWHQDQALNATIFLLRETGPTSFVLKEDDVEKRVRVTLGDPHTCTCDTFRRENVPCKHICWIILKKFKWPRNNEIAFQHGLVEREINLLLRGPRKVIRGTSENSRNKSEEKFTEKGTLKQREITKVDVCPICQEELLTKHAAVTYCKFGCGNSIHIKCMKIWAEHQRNSSQDSEIKCPICRASFGSYYKLLEELRNSEGENDPGLDIHFSTSCAGCEMCPIKGKCYKCTSCESLYLCNACFHSNKHRQHTFEFRIKRQQRWRPAKLRNNNYAFEMSILNDLGSRDITEDDYDLLLRLDGENQPSEAVDLSGLPLHIINSLPLMKVRVGTRLLAPGKQCRICLRNYEVGQFVRKLPDCKHIFHKDCIDAWLSEDHRRCPIDHKLVEMYRRPPSTQDTEQATNHNSGDTMQLIVPGVGIAKLQHFPTTDNSKMTHSHGQTVRNYHNFAPGNRAVNQESPPKFRMFDKCRNNQRRNPSLLPRRNCQSGASRAAGNTYQRHRVDSAPIQTQSTAHTRYNYGPYEWEETSLSTPTINPMDAAQVKNELPGVCLYEMLETIDGVLPARKQNLLCKRAAQAIEKGLASRRNAGLPSKHNQFTTDLNFWLQGNSIAHDESSNP